jgi:hypothetical protein
VLLPVVAELVIGDTQGASHLGLVAGSLRERGLDQLAFQRLDTLLEAARCEVRGLVGRDANCRGRYFSRATTGAKLPQIKRFPANGMGFDSGFMRGSVFIRSSIFAKAA